MSKRLYGVSSTFSTCLRMRYVRRGCRTTVRIKYLWRSSWLGRTEKWNFLRALEVQVIPIILFTLTKMCAVPLLELKEHSLYKRKLHFTILDPCLLIIIIFFSLNVLVQLILSNF